jgi:hypothetical protein
METLKQIGNPQPKDGSDVNNYSSSINEFPPAICTYLRLLVVSPENWCISLLFSLIVDFWIDAIAQISPRSSAGIPYAQLDFNRWKQSYMETFINNFVAKYDSASLTKTIAKITFGHICGFLHTSLFMAWLHLVCNRKKPSVELPSDCLVGYFARPVIYYAAGWTIYKASKALTVARDKRPVYYRFEAAQSINASLAKSIGLQLILQIGCNEDHQCTAGNNILNLLALLRISIWPI